MLNVSFLITRSLQNDKVNCYYAVSKNNLKYNKTDQDKCVECRNVTFLKNVLKFVYRAVEIRNNDNAIISRTKNKLIVGSPPMALDKLNFVLKE